MSNILKRLSYVNSSLEIALSFKSSSSDNNSITSSKLFITTYLLSQLEGGLFSFRERIRNTKRNESYIERIDLFLNSVLNENSIQDIKNLLLEIKENEFVVLK